MKIASVVMLAALMAACGDAVPDAARSEASSSAVIPADSTAGLSDLSSGGDVAGGSDADAAGAGEPANGAAADREGAPSADRNGAEPVNGAGATTDATPTSSAADPSSAASQSDVAAILRRASTAYEDVRSMRASFVMNREIPVLKQTITSRGTLYQQSPDRIALIFSDPAGDVIMSDGEFFWYYTPSVNADQVIQSPATAGGRSGVDLQAQFVGNPVDRFDATLHGTETVDGRTTNVLTLVPRQRAEYRSLKVWLDTRDSLARRFEIVEHNGSSRRFDLGDLRTNVTIPATTFQFTPPPGARVIQPG